MIKSEFEDNYIGRVGYFLKIYVSNPFAFRSRSAAYTIPSIIDRIFASATKSDLFSQLFLFIDFYSFHYTVVRVFTNGFEIFQSINKSKHDLFGTIFFLIRSNWKLFRSESNNG